MPSKYFSSDWKDTQPARRDAKRDIKHMGHHTQRRDILKNMFVYGATVLTLVAILGVIALVILGIYKLGEWMMSL